jgi:hypothetical protein
MGASWKLTEAQLREWLVGLLAENDVVAPAEEDGVMLFRRILSEDEAVVEPSGKTRWSPKEFLFPRTEAGPARRSRPARAASGAVRSPEL